MAGSITGSDRSAMVKLPSLDPRATRLAVSSAALGVMYWGLYRVPLPVAGEGLERDDAGHLIEVAATMRKFGRWEKARGPLERLHAAYPDNHIYMRDLAVTYRQLRQFEAEAGMWAMFLDHSPTPFEACPRAGHAWSDAGQISKMFETLDRCVELAPGDPDMLFHRAHAHERWGNPAGAEAAYAAGLERFPASSDMVLGLARIRLRQGREREALLASRKVLDSSPDNTDALLAAGLAAKASGDLVAARRYLERGAALAPAYADFHLALAEIAARQRDLAGARRHYQRILESEPGNREAKAKLEALGEL